MEIINISNLYYQIIYAAIIIIVAYFLVKVVKFIKSKSKLSKMDENLTNLINDLIRYIIYIFALILIFDVFGIDLTSIFVSIGILGITIGFAAKDILSNFVSGIFVISDKNINIGDTIQIGNIKGKIKKISFRTTTLVDKDGIYSVIPNSVLSNQAYNKYKNFEDLRIDLNIEIPINTNIEEFKEKIINEIQDIKELNNKKNPEIFVDKITKDTVIITLSVWIKNYSKLDSVKLKIADKVRFILLTNN